MKKNCFLLLFLLCACLVQAQDTYRTDKDVPYISGSETDAYRLERCKLDVYYPENKKDFSTIVWFHGGGMEGGSKFVPKELTDQGFAVVAVNYRLSPKAKNPAYIEDAAEAVAWTFRNIEKYGGRKDRIFVSGHSAGGYLCLLYTSSPDGKLQRRNASFAVINEELEDVGTVHAVSYTHLLRCLSTR